MGSALEEDCETGVSCEPGVSSAPGMSSVPGEGCDPGDSRASEEGSAPGVSRDAITEI